MQIEREIDDIRLLIMHVRYSYKSKRYFGDTFCIYLDQFAISNLADEVENWKSVKELIDLGVKTKRIVCPMPFEHLLETSRKHEANAISQHEYFRKISDDFIFRNICFITGQLLISWVRKNNVTKNTFLDKLNPYFSFENSLNKFTWLHTEYDEMISEGTLLPNTARAAARDRKMSKGEQDNILPVLKSLGVQEFIKRLEELVNEGGIVIRSIKFQKREVTHWIDYVLDVLMKKNKMIHVEAKKMLANLKRCGFNEISALDVRNTLESYIAVQQKKQTANDEIDISRIAAAIQISDIMVIDKARKFELIETELDKKYGTKIFSGTEEDICKLQNLLEQII